MQVNNQQKLQIYGVTFNGIQEIKRIAFGSGYYNGVYVGVDSQSYPCFDSWDYANENRCYCNFIFAKSKDEVQSKLTALKQAKPGFNYNKMNEMFYPMIYWQGDSYHPIVIGECEEIMCVAPKAKRVKEKSVKEEISGKKSRMELLMEKLRNDNRKADNKEKDE